MANRNAKLIERVLKDFSLNIGSGGTEVVNELPETGKEHTVYELSKEVPSDFSWLLTEFDPNNAYPTMNTYQAVVVENEEDVTQEYLAMSNGFLYAADNHCIVYVKNTGNVYDCYMVEVEVVGKESPYKFSKTQLELITDKTGNKYYKVERILFIILTDFNYSVDNTGERPILNGTGHYLDGTVYDYHTGSNRVVPLVLTNGTDKKIGLTQNLVGGLDVTDAPLPIPEEDLITKIDLSILEKIFTIGPVFAPSSEPHTEVSYWIYTNNTWVNLDNVGEIVMPVMSIGDGGFHYTGLDLKYFDFYINGIKAECIQYGTLVIPGDEGTAGNDMVYPIGYLKGIVLPTPENNHYSVEVRFTGTAKQLSGMKYLFVSAITFKSRTIDQITFKEPMTLEFDGLHELIINCREGNM